VPVQRRPHDVPQPGAQLFVQPVIRHCNAVRPVAILQAGGPALARSHFDQQLAEEVQVARLAGQPVRHRQVRRAAADAALIVAGAWSRQPLPHGAICPRAYPAQKAGPRLPRALHTQGVDLLRGHVEPRVHARKAHLQRGGGIDNIGFSESSHRSPSSRVFQMNLR